MKKVLITLAILTLSACFAQEMRPQQGEKREPPKEAITVCEGESKDALCTVETPRGDTLEGTCQNTPDGKYFACVPNNHKKHK